MSRKRKKKQGATKTGHAAKTSHPKKLKNPTLLHKVEAGLFLMRIDRPIGIMLLLWPTLWALWFAAEGTPTINNLVIFTLGCVLMRSAGCVINDYADRKIDGKVTRTKNRPLVNGLLSPREAILIFIILCSLAFLLVLLTNPLTIQLSLGGAFLAALYPFTKRYTHLPQLFLGLAFGWSVPMAWAAEAETLVPATGLLYTIVILWALVYDTFYAMVDREDDIRAGIKSIAILFGEADRFMTGMLQALMIFALLLIGQQFSLEMYFHAGVAIAGLLFVYQQYLIRERDPEKCFQAFLNNNWVGCAVFVGLAVDFYF
jgi:4-hydroxybenzoate polyprenyltransferase